MHGVRAEHAGRRAARSRRARRSSLRARAQQRVLCAVFVGAPRRAPPALEPQLDRAASKPSARAASACSTARASCCSTDSSPPSEQAVAAAHCALALRQHAAAPRPSWSAPGARSSTAGCPSATSSSAARCCSPRRRRASCASTRRARRCSTHASRFRAARRAAHARARARGRRGAAHAARPGHAVRRPRPRARRSSSMLFHECVDESVARAVLVTAPAGAGKSRLRYELVQRLRETGEPLRAADRARRLHAHGHAVRRARARLCARWAEIASDDPLELKREKLRAARRRASLPERQRAQRSRSSSARWSACPSPTRRARSCAPRAATRS